MKHHITVAIDEQASNQNNDTTENEAKRVEIKEYWAVVSEMMPAQFTIYTFPVKYYTKGDDQHLSWYPPVATPPPNFQV